MLLLPPAPAALVLAGRVLATLSARSAAAFLLIAVAGPPGGFGEAGRAVDEPVDGGELTGEDGRGEGYEAGQLMCIQLVICFSLECRCCIVDKNILASS